MKLTKIFLLLATLGALLRVSANPLAPPGLGFGIVAETVSILVRPNDSFVTGAYTFQPLLIYRPQPESRDFAVKLPVFVATGMAKPEDAVAAALPRLKVAGREYAPIRAAFGDPEALKGTWAVPANVQVCWMYFEVPSDRLPTRFTVEITYLQPHYLFDGKRVAAYWPLLPNHSQIVRELGLGMDAFLVSFEATEGLKLECVTPNETIVTNTPQRIAVRPKDRENIVVALTELPPKASAPSAR